MCGNIIDNICEQISGYSDECINSLYGSDHTETEMCRALLDCTVRGIRDKTYKSGCWSTFVPLS